MPFGYWAEGLQYGATCVVGISVCTKAPETVAASCFILVSGTAQLRTLRTH